MSPRETESVVRLRRAIDLHRRRNPGRWYEDTLDRNRSLLSASVGPHRVPPGHPDVLGCGQKGCATKTPEEGVVLKLTSDRSEAAVFALVRNGSLPAVGFPHCYAVVSLPPEPDGTGPWFAVWREEILAPAMVSPTCLQVDSRAVLAFDERLNAFLAGAYDVRYDHQGGRAPTPGALRALGRSASTLARGEYAASVGVALRNALDLGVVLTDARAENLGWVLNSDGDWPMAVIYDPGMAIDLSGQLAAVRIPRAGARVAWRLPRRPHDPIVAR